MKRPFAEAILSSFRDDTLIGTVRTLGTFNRREWVRGVRWLDESGLALYLLSRLETTGSTNTLPQDVLCGLSRNLADNRAQSAELIDEFAIINCAFRGLRLRYATLKGFSLIPDYCPDPALRCQFDFDFLIDRTAVSSFASALRTLGYQLVHAGEDAWEFKKKTDQLPSVRDLYKPKPQKAVELHFELGHSCEEPFGDCLGRAEERRLPSLEFPALSAADAFTFQSLHLFKHIGSEWTRLSWLLEFRNFILAHRADHSFWQEVRTLAGNHRECTVAIGVTTLLATMAFGEFAPTVLTEWTVCALPMPVHLWVVRYGWNVLLADFPGTKLYLLLQRELMEQQEWRRLRRTRLLPFHRAPRVIQRSDSRQKVFDFDQLRYSALRVRFHLIEGLRYLIESVRWKRIRAVPHASTTRVNRVAADRVATRSWT